MLNDIKKLDIKNLPPVLLICGEEEFLIDQALDYVKRNIIDVISNEFDRDVFNSDEIDVLKLIDITKSYPFTSEKRSLIVKNAEKLFNLTSKKADKNSAFIKYINSPSEYTFLVLTSTYDGLNGLTKSFSTKIKSLKSPFSDIVQKFEWIEYSKVWDNQFAQWIRNRLKTKNITIGDAALQLIISNTNPNLRDISNEIDKLIIYTNGRKNIEEADVIASTGVSRKYNVYELQKAVGAGNIIKSLEIADNLISNDKAEMLIITVLTRYMMALFKLFEFSNVSEANKYEVAGIIGTNAYFLNEYKNALSSLGIGRIEKSFSHLAQADTDLKSLNIDSKNIIQKMIINILS